MSGCDRGNPLLVPSKFGTPFTAKSCGVRCWFTGWPWLARPGKTGCSCSITNWTLLVVRWVVSRSCGAQLNLGGSGVWAVGSGWFGSGARSVLGQVTLQVGPREVEQPENAHPYTYHYGVLVQVSQPLLGGSNESGLHHPSPSCTSYRPRRHRRAGDRHWTKCPEPPEDLTAARTKQRVGRLVVHTGGGNGRERSEADPTWTLRPSGCPGWTTPHYRPFGFQTGHPDWRVLV